MFKRFSKFSLSLFIVAALATFVLLGASLFFAQAFLTSRGAPARSNVANYGQAMPTADPLITKVPDLKDVLTGPLITSADPSLGAAGAPVTLVEFSDYQCAFCHEQEKNLEALMKNYPDKIRLIWKDYPESDPASLSFKAAVAARCAGQQDKYWAFHDALFQLSGLSAGGISRLARDLKLNQSAFSACLNDPATARKVKNNIKEADALGIGGIPFIFINQREVLGQTGLNELMDLVKQELK